MLSSQSDPIFGILLVALGVFWTWTSVLYIRASRRSKASSSLYSEVFDHPEDAFEEGKQTSQQHARRGKILSVMGVTVILFGLVYLSSVIFF